VFERILEQPNITAGLKEKRISLNLKRKHTQKDGSFVYPIEFHSFFSSGYLRSLLFHHVDHDSGKIHWRP